MPSTKKVKRILNRSICIVFSLIIILSSLPASAFALDPVSTITMANAFAQAITAYGASHGISMIFDVTNTSQIGENVHELWKRFRSGQQTIDDYMEIAAAIWPSLYNKVVDAGKAYVGIRLAAEYVSELDEFYDWLLSGPAELEKVDNQYYEWTLNEFDQVDPISVYSYSIYSLNGLAVGYLPTGGVYDYYYDSSIRHSFSLSNSSPNNSTSPVLYYFLKVPSSNDNYFYYLYCFSDSNQNTVLVNRDGNTSLNISINDVGDNYYYRLINAGSFGPVSSSSVNCYPYFDSSSLDTLPSSIYGNLDSNFISSLSMTEDSISVAPYVGEASPEDVYIPDTDDPDYGPLPYFGPLNIPWLDVYGNGIDSLTDAQSEAITNKLDDVISQLKTLYLEGDGVLDNADTQFYDTFHSILPFTNLPSFRLNLSGIWYYVVNWVSTLSSWFILMRGVWSRIPYQFSIPVYASAVVVIVLGVYKRFFM